ncbi:MAG: lysophospholipid acyltransferase family protein [Saprospiraceae bacterium]
MKYILAFVRFSLLVICTLAFLIVLIFVNAVKGASIQRALRYRKSCVRVMLKIVGIKIIPHGRFEQINPAIYISNHRCISDPLIALKYFECFPIGKAEIDKYPLIGFAARLTGILFVQRDQKESRNLVKEGIRTALQKEINIFLCPEGTTNLAQTTKEFKLGSFDVAAELKVPMVPMALVYNDPSSDFWLPGDSLLLHFVRQFGKWETRVDLYFPEKSFINSDPIRLMNECKSWIDSKLISIKVPDKIADLAVYNLKV